MHTTDTINTRRDILLPTSILMSDGIENEQSLLVKKDLQVTIPERDVAIIKKGGYVVLDFGREIHGGARLLLGEVSNHNVRIRVRFGESLGEACSEIGVNGSTNDHAPRDRFIEIGSHVDTELGNTGFRFIRLDLIKGEFAKLKSILAVYVYQDSPYIGSFKCDNELLNDIYKTAQHTIHLCLQNGHIWDGIKRDRAVWSGDLHPEMLSIYNVFGDLPNVKNSLKLCIANTPKDEWMNCIPSYSMWWIINLYEYYFRSGDVGFVKGYIDDVYHILRSFDSAIDNNGKIDFSVVNLNYWEESDMFFDWPTSLTPNSRAGVRALLQWGVLKASNLLNLCNESAEICNTLLKKLNAGEDKYQDVKQVTAMRVFAGKENGDEALRKLVSGGAKGLTSFMSYYIFTAIAECGAKKDALEIVEQFYGAMLSKGATTFWEDFNIEWLENSCNLDELPKEGQKNIHGDFGAHCYKGYRHSLCHGWSTGVIPFLVEQILGVKLVEAAYKKILIKPEMCGLKNIKAAIPTPHGKIEIVLAQQENKVVLNAKVPKQIEIQVKDVCESDIVYY